MSCPKPKQPGSPALPFIQVLDLVRVPIPQVTEQVPQLFQLLQPVKDKTFLICTAIIGIHILCFMTAILY